MSKKKNPLLAQLTAALAPHLGGEGRDARPSKAVAKALQQLTKQMTKAQRKPAKVTAPKAPSVKEARNSLARELGTLVQPHLSTNGQEEAAAGKKVSKALQRLAAQLVAQRRKQDKNAAKAARKEVKAQEKPAANPTMALAKKAVPSPAATGRRQPAARRPATTTSARATLVSAPVPAPVDLPATAE